MTAVRKGNELNYLHSDHLASTRLVTSNSGAIVNQLDYYPYGSLQSINNQLTINTPSINRLYTSQILDSSTDLYFYNARQYNPVTAAFISADSASGPNRYAYVSGNPISRNDPSGNISPFSYLAASGRAFQSIGILTGTAGTIINIGGSITEKIAPLYPEEMQVLDPVSQMELGTGLWTRDMMVEGAKNMQTLGSNLMTGGAGIISAGQLLEMAGTGLEAIKSSLSEIYWKLKYSQQVKIFNQNNISVSAVTPEQFGKEMGGDITFFEGKGSIRLTDTYSYQERLAALGHEGMHAGLRKLYGLDNPLSLMQVTTEEYLAYQDVANNPNSSQTMRANAKSMMEGIAKISMWEDYPLDVRLRCIADFVGFKYNEANPVQSTFDLLQ